MDSGYLKLVELLLLFGGVLAFGAWQLRSVERDRRKRLAAEAQAAAQAARQGPPTRCSDHLSSTGIAVSPAEAGGAKPAPEPSTGPVDDPLQVTDSKHSQNQSDS